MLVQRPRELEVEEARDIVVDQVSDTGSGEDQRIVDLDEDVD